MSSLFDDTSFTIIEWLALTGLAQSLLIIVYIVFRVRLWRQAALALAYFGVLALAFGLQFALRLEDYERPLRLALWFMRASAPPLCYLLVLQIARGAELPHWRRFWVLLLPPLALTAGFFIRAETHVCVKESAALCESFFLWLQWLGAIGGGLSLLALWGHKSVFTFLRKAKGGAERYWLVLLLILFNAGAVGIMFLQSMGRLDLATADALKVVMGLAFIYLAITTMFRIYPSPVQLSDVPTRFTRQTLSESEKDLSHKIRKLMDMDKLYHEPSFSRGALARELNVSENILSRVINVAFGKSFPRFLNEYRVEDAKRMLEAPDIPIQVVASEVGFNSLASFNRAFREITSITPSQYRAAALEEKSEQKEPA